MSLLRASEDERHGGGLPPAGAVGGILDSKVETIVDAAKWVLNVVPGERPLEPRFGCRLHFLEDFSRPAVRTLAAALVEEALEHWAPHLRIEAAEVVGVDGNRVHVRLRSRQEWHDLTVVCRGPGHPGEGGEKH